MKKILLLIAWLCAASFSFAGGDKNCSDKSKCDDKADKSCCCCKSGGGDEKACAASHDAKAHEEKPAAKSGETSEKK